MAIGMLPIRYKMEHPDLENVILVGGDGDLIDAVDFLQDVLKVKVFVVAWSACLSNKLGDKAFHVLRLDELFDDISEPTVNARLTNADKLKKHLEGTINLDILVEAATHKYPDEHDYNNCLNFALELNKMF